MAKPSQLEKLEKQFNKNPSSRLFFPIAEAYRNNGEYEHAIEIYKQGLENHPNYISARVSLARTLIAVNRLDEAREELENVVRSVPDNLMGQKLLAEIYVSQGEIPQALTQFKKVLQLNPNDNEAKIKIEELSAMAPPKIMAETTITTDQEDDVSFDVEEKTADEQPPSKLKEAEEDIKFKPLEIKKKTADEVERKIDEPEQQLEEASPPEILDTEEISDLDIDKKVDEAFEIAQEESELDQVTEEDKAKKETEPLFPPVDPDLETPVPEESSEPAISEPEFQDEIV
ncbi:tetratricopeptide repeat protein, partial [candidate division CSSED10-310 bacterium]